MPPGYGGSLVGGELDGTIADGTDDATDDDIGEGAGAGAGVSLLFGRKYPMTIPSRIARKTIAMTREVGRIALSLFISFSL
jgi:hypothetical protein